MKNKPICVHPSDKSMSECYGWFRETLQALPTGWIAGGSLRDYFQRKPCNSDVDVFFRNPDDLAEGIWTIERTNSTRIYDKPNIRGYMFKGQHIQLIKNRFFDGPEETIAEFDFTVCCAAIDQSGLVYVHEDFFEDLAANRLSINQLDYPLGTLARLPRYIGKGFQPCKGTLLKLAKAMQSVDFANPVENELQFYSHGGQRFGRFEAVDSAPKRQLVAAMSHEAPYPWF